MARHFSVDVAGCSRLNRQMPCGRGAGSGEGLVRHFPLLLSFERKLFFVDRERRLKEESERKTARQRARRAVHASTQARVTRSCPDTSSENVKESERSFPVVAAAGGLHTTEKDRLLSSSSSSSFHVVVDSTRDREREATEEFR